MNNQNIYKFISIDGHSITPKYRQLSNSILRGIESGKIEKGYLLPSINDLSYELDISRDTTEKAYRHLKKMGVLGSIPGKGCFIAKTEITGLYKILILFNKLSAHKKIIYDSIVSALGKKAAIDFYVYNNEFSYFKNILLDRKDDYTHYIIIPHFFELEANAAEVLNQIEKGKLILLDKKISGVVRPFGSVYENFEKDIYGALEKAQILLKAYKTIKIIFPSYSYYPSEILKGFKQYCETYSFSYKIVHNVIDEPINKGDVFINLMEDDLALLLEKITGTDFAIGKDIGIISYNETPLKQFILNGITTISTNFYKMGDETAKMILNNENKNIEIPFKLSLRPSL